MAQGVIYILTNPSFPEYVKIGYAAKLEERLRQLNRSEAIPYAFRAYATYKGYDEISREIQELEQKISWNKKKITVLNDKKKNADSEKAKIIKEEIKDLRNEKKHNQQELDELKNLYKISDEIEEI